ncbi:MAG TPA: ABC transporter ATP-binding protein [Chloroflexota bacterium]|nr:ABC transporter ATP-binding protein [Chloroflexota bacterium]
MSTLLSVENLRVVFHTRDGDVNAVNGISWTLGEGETLGIVGESGSGKSVSNLAIMGLLPVPPAQVTGSVRYAGQDLLTLRPEQMRRVRGKEIAMVFQDPMTFLNPVMTIGRQISEAVELHLGLTGLAALNRTVELLDLVGIPSARERVNNYPHQFSGGMRQRVMIAMALSCTPRLLIADEPTTALDVTIQAQILDLLARLRRELGTAIVLISHDLGVVAGLCERIAVMYAGSIVELGTAREVFKNPRHPYTIGLLNSITRVDRRRQDRLIPIEGAPPDLIALPPGCPFAPRCAYRFERCGVNPRLERKAPNHFAACWANLEGGKAT